MVLAHQPPVTLQTFALTVNGQLAPGACPIMAHSRLKAAPRRLVCRTCCRQFVHCVPAGVGWAVSHCNWLGLGLCTSHVSRVWSKAAGCFLPAGTIHSMHNTNRERSREAFRRAPHHSDNVYIYILKDSFLLVIVSFCVCFVG